MPLPTIVLPAHAIVVPPDRIRQDPSEEIESLAHSIESLGQLVAAEQRKMGLTVTGREGLLHLPLVRMIAPDRAEIVVGVRRYLACTEVLGWREMEVAVLYAADDPLVRVQAETDENNARRNFTTYERLLAVQQRIEVEREQAYQRQQAGKPVPNGAGGRALERAGAAGGYSHVTAAHGLAVLDAAATQPELYGDLALALQHNAPVDKVWQEMNHRQRAGETPLPTYHPPVAPEVAWLADRLDGVSSSIRTWLFTHLNIGPTEAKGYSEIVCVGDKEYLVSVSVRPKE